jgi:hypothetical protein
MGRRRPRTTSPGGAVQGARLESQPQAGQPVGSWATYTCLGAGYLQSTASRAQSQAVEANRSPTGWAAQAARESITRTLTEELARLTRYAAGTISKTIRYAVRSGREDDGANIAAPVNRSVSTNIGSRGGVAVAKRRQHVNIHQRGRKSASKD